MQHLFQCMDCGWSSTSAPAPDHRETTKQAIAHHLETGHEINAASHVERSVEAGSNPGQETPQPAE